MALPPIVPKLGHFWDFGIKVLQLSCQVTRAILLLVEVPGVNFLDVALHQKLDNVWVQDPGALLVSPKKAYNGVLIAVFFWTLCQLAAGLQDIEAKANVVGVQSSWRHRCQSSF